MGQIVAVILAAGESKRMNFPKMVLPFNGKTIIERVIDNVSASKADTIIVIVGAEKDKITELIEEYPVTILYNDIYKNGMLSSVRCGIDNLKSGTDAAIFFLGDQPWISPEVTDKVINSYRTSSKGIVIPVCKGKRGHPLLVSSEYFGEIEKLDADMGLRQLFLKFPHDIIEVETESPEILKDIDTPEDYKKEITQKN